MAAHYNKAESDAMLRAMTLAGEDYEAHEQEKARRAEQEAWDALQDAYRVLLKAQTWESWDKGALDAAWHLYQSAWVDWTVAWENLRGRTAYIQDYTAKMIELREKRS